MLGGGIEILVHGRVKDNDDLAIDLDGVRDPYRILGEYGGQRLCSGCLASARGAVEEDGLTRVESSAELGESLETLIKAGYGLYTSSIERAPRDQELKLSFAQQRLWFLDQLQPDSPFYNIPAALRLTGQLNLTAFEQTLNEIVRRHEVLRIAYLIVDGQPMQVVTPADTLNVPLIDISHLPEAEREQELQRLIEEEAQRPFHLWEAPLLRTTLLRLGEAGRINTGVERAGAEGFDAGAIDGVQARVARFQGARPVDGGLDAAEADVADLERLLDVAEDQGGVAEAARREGLPALNAGTAAVAVGGGGVFVGREQGGGVLIDFLQVKDVDNFVAGGIDVEEDVARANLAEIEVKVGEEVKGGARIGNLSGGSAGSTLYFEIRIGQETADPAEWFGI